MLSPDMELFFLFLENTGQHQDVLQNNQSAKRYMLRQRYKLMVKISTQSLKMQSKRLKNFLVRTKILTSWKSPTKTRSCEYPQGMNIGIVGATGQVGTVMREILAQRNFSH